MKHISFKHQRESKQNSDNTRIYIRWSCANFEGLVTIGKKTRWPPRQILDLNTDPMGKVTIFFFLLS